MPKKDNDKQAFLEEIMKKAMAEANEYPTDEPKLKWPEDEKPERSKK